MLVLSSRRHEKITLTDKASGTVIVIESFTDETGRWKLGFTAPKTVEVVRERVNAKIRPSCLKIV